MSTWDSHMFWKATHVDEILKTVICESGKRVALVMGAGFDPRMTDCLKLLASYDDVQIQVHLLRLGRPGSVNQEELADLVTKNTDKVDELLGERGSVTSVDTEFEEEDRNSTAPSASDKSAEFARDFDPSGIDSVIVDISSLPQGLYFPLLEVLIAQRRDDFSTNKTSLYVFVSENIELDGRITPLELQEDAYMVPPFRSALTGTDDTRPIIWFPVLGEGEYEQLTRIQKLLPPRVELEVCPVLPMPSSNPRRADMLIREYEPALQNIWLIDSRSFIYSDEQNPFHLYSQLIRAASRYRKALSEIGGCRAVISCHSSKLLSLGALLAASELNQIDSDDFAVGLANVDATAYRLKKTEVSEVSSTCFLVPILGEVYEG